MQTKTLPMILLGLVLSTMIASWPHAVWLAQRAQDGSDDPWGVLALVTMLGLVWRDKAQLQLPHARNLAVSAALVVMASVALSQLPPILAAALALLGLAVLLWGMLPQRPLLPLLALAMLSLPLVASLNFYLGYPLRWLCAAATAQVLSLTGLDVVATGAALLWGGKTVLIDAPCAGIAMLWVGLYLGMLFSYLNMASAARTMVNGLLAIGIVLLGNILRNTLLFYKEANIVTLPHWTHEGIGLLVFGLMVWLIYQATHINLQGAQHAKN